MVFSLGLATLDSSIANAQGFGGNSSRQSAAAGFGPQRSNLYQGEMSPIAPPSGNQPAQLLNYLTPPSGVTARPASSTRPDESIRPWQDTDGRESIDGLLERNADHFGTRDFVTPTQGGTEVIRQRYPDGQIQVEREMIQDAEGNYQNHGWWRLYNQSGQVIADGIFERGLMEGPWKRLHNPNEGGIFAGAPFSLFQGPFLSTATFEKGKLNGVWQVHDRSQRKVMEMTYLNGKRHGPANWWFPNGNKMREMTFHNGMIDGKLVEWDSNQRIVRDEEFIEGRKVTITTSEFPSGKKKTQLQSLDAKMVLSEPDDWWAAKPAKYEPEGEPYRSGPFAAWYENGQLEMQGQYIDDKREGQFIWWHSNGQKRVVGQFKDDLKEGNWVWWHPNGMKMAEGNYREDREVGLWLKWDDNGKIIDRRNLSDDELPDPKRSPAQLPGPVSNQEVPVPKLDEKSDELPRPDRGDPPLGGNQGDGTEARENEDLGNAIDPFLFSQPRKIPQPGFSTSPFRPRHQRSDQIDGPLLPPTNSSRATQPAGHRSDSALSESPDELLQRLFRDDLN